MFVSQANFERFHSHLYNNPFAHGVISWKMLKYDTQCMVNDNRALCKFQKVSRFADYDYIQ